MQEVKSTDTINISKKMLVGGIIGIVVIAAIVLGLVFFNPLKSSDNSVVAKVNGEKIYQSQVDQLKTTLQTQSPLPLEDSAVVEQLVVQSVLLQQAQKNGIMVATEEAEVEVSKVLAKNGETLETFKTQLSSAGIDYSTALEDFKKQLTVQKLIEANVEIREISDTEARQYYDENKAVLFQGAEPPAYETIEEDLKTYIQQQESQPAILAYVQGLKSQAEIELL